MPRRAQFTLIQTEKNESELIKKVFEENKHPSLAHYPPEEWFAYIFPIMAQKPY